MRSYYHEIMGMAILPQYLSLKLGAYATLPYVSPPTNAIPIPYFHIHLLFCPLLISLQLPLLALFLYFQ